MEVVAVGAVMATAALVALGPVPSAEHWFAAIFFALFGFLASGLGYQTSRETSGTIGFLPFLSVAMIAPSYAAVVSVGAAVLASELLVRRKSIKLLFNVSQQTLAESLAVSTYLTLGGVSILDKSPSVVAFVAMVAVFMTVNKLAVSSVVSAGTGSMVSVHWVQSVRGSVIYDVLAFPLIFFFAYAFSEFGAWWAASFALPMLGLRQLYKSNFALQKINEELLQLMVAAIEARDPYTSGHSQRVARYARVIARKAGFKGRDADRVVIAALLHDVGKIHEEFAPILRKPGRLTECEFEVMKSHSAKSAVLVGKVSHFADLVPSVRSHHESWDGRGYPDGLAGDAIPRGARVIALADTIDAMSTSRPYRDSLDADSVRAEIETQSGRQFDPRICKAILDSRVWIEIQREIALATSEYPVLSVPSEPLSGSADWPTTVRLAPSVQQAAEVP